MGKGVSVTGIPLCAAALLIIDVPLIPARPERNNLFERLTKEFSNQI